MGITNFDSAETMQNFDSRGSVAITRVTYDVARDGGGIGVHTLSIKALNGTVHFMPFYFVNETFTSATDAATIGLSLAVNGDIQPPVAISDGGNPWDAGFHGSGGAGTPVATAERAIQVTVANETLTAGKVTFLIIYFFV